MRDWILKHKWLLIILVLVVFVRVLFIFQSPIEIWDETIYANLGHQLSEDFFDYSLKSSYWTDFIPGGEYPYSWPNIGFRAPVLPYTLSIFYYLGMDFFVPFFIPLIGVICVFLVYYLGRLMFNEKVGLYASLMFSILPLVVLNSSMIFTGTYGIFFFLLSLISFWKGFELGENKCKILFGVFFALTILTRYTFMLFGLGFFLYFILKNKGISFLKDKYLWAAVFGFVVVMIPWLIYGGLFYGNILGGFIHGTIASSYWGGIQPWHFFFEYWYSMFSIVGLVLLASIFYIFKRKIYFRKNLMLVLILFFNFLILAMSFAHKEERFLLPIVIPLVYLSAYFVSKMKKQKLWVIGIIILSLFSLGVQFYQLRGDYYNGTNKCFLESMDFINMLPDNSLIINDESSVIYYYTHKQIRVPRGYSVDEILSRTNSENSYLLYTDVNMPLYIEDNKRIKDSWDETFESVFYCDKDWGISEIYKIN